MLRLKVDENETSGRNSAIVAPEYDGGSISNLPGTFAKLLNLDAGRPLTDKNFYDFVKVSSIENVVFLLLDGFGMNALINARRKTGIPSFERIEKKSLVTTLTSVFPSTTSTATTTLHTGLTPQEHGVIGYTAFLSELGSVTQMLQMAPIFGRKSIFELGHGQDLFFGEKTIHERFVEAGISSNLYINKYIVGSGLSQITNKGANVNPILTPADLFVRLRKNLESAASSPAFHFAYYASPDTIAHARGPFSLEYAAEVENLFQALNSQLLEKIDPTIGKSTVLLISADHGLSQIAREDVIDLAEHKELLGLLKVPPTGDSRCVFFHAKREQAKAEIQTYLNSKFPNDLLILKSKDALNEGLFGRGKIKEQVIDRIGDLIAIPRSNKAIDNSLLQPRSEHVPGRHGGMSQDEMLVPLIASRLG